MRMTGGTQRHENPLLGELHALGLKYGLKMVVVAIPMNADDPNGVRPILIDHKDHTPLEDLSPMFTRAGVFLIKCAGAAEEHLAGQTAQEEGGT
jgi:hypothetical protein